MTPLNRWVFLPLLLGSAVAVRAHLRYNACSYVSLTEKRATLTYGVCDHHRLFVQSLEERQGWFDYFFQLCLLPCSGSRTGDRLVYIDTVDCRSFRKALIGIRGCTIDATRDTRPWDPVTSLRWLVRNVLRRDDESYDYGRPVEEILKYYREEGNADLFYVINYLFDERNFLVFLGRVWGLYDREKMITEAAAKGIERADGQTDDTTVQPDVSEEKPIDWEMWCMAQCDHGQGGAACNCDLIP